MNREIPGSIGHDRIFEILDDISKYNMSGICPDGTKTPKGHHFIWLIKGRTFIVVNDIFPSNNEISHLMTVYDCSYEDALQIAGVDLRIIHPPHVKHV